LSLLAKNIYENKLQDQIKIITNPLTQQNEFADFAFSSIEEGGALSAFGVDHDHDGKPMNKILTYQTLGLSLDFLIANNIISERPSLIKIDVDGIEHLILAGAIGGQRTHGNPNAQVDFQRNMNNLSNSLNCLEGNYLCKPN
jgi:FkbM family methyltransferase